MSNQKNYKFNELFKKKCQNLVFLILLIKSIFLFYFLFFVLLIILNYKIKSRLFEIIEDILGIPHFFSSINFWKRLSSVFVLWPFVLPIYHLASEAEITLQNQILKEREKEQ